MRMEPYLHLRIGSDEKEANVEPYGTKLDPGWSRDLQSKLVRADIEHKYAKLNRSVKSKVPATYPLPTSPGYFTFRHY